jgi:hypothetical protein
MESESWHHEKDQPSDLSDGSDVARLGWRMRGRRRADHGEPDAAATVSLEGDAGEEVGRNLVRLKLGLVSLQSVGPAYFRGPHGFGVRVDADIVPVDAPRRA